MTPNEINEAIAVSLGYRLEPRRYAGGWWITPNNNASMSPPDYYSSLDACAEFEASLSVEMRGDTHSERYLYYGYLQDVTNECAMNIISATAPHRCEAYLRVRGLWK